MILALTLISASALAAPLTLTDMAGRTVSLTSDPGRIVCLGPGALRLIVYLDACEKVAGVEQMEKRHSGGRPYWIANPQLAKLPNIGPGGPASINKKPDLEALLRVRPEVIFATYMDAPLANEVQQTLGIPLVVLSYGELATFDEAVYDALRIAGKVLNRKQRADDVVNYVESRRKDLQARTANVPDAQSQRAYVGGIGHRGAHGIESTEKSYIPLDWLNAVNLSEKLESRIGSHVFADKESLLRLNPNVIFIDGAGLALMAEDYRKKPEFYKALTAFQKRKVYTLLPFNFYTTNIGTALADAHAIGKILFPDRFRDVDPEKKADEIYKFLVGQAVYEQMKKDYGVIGQTAPFLK